MSGRTTYKARATRSGDWWAVEVPDVPGALGQSKRLDRVDVVAREVIALVLDVPEESFDVMVEVELPPDVRGWVDEVEAAKAEADAAQRLAAQCQVDVARRLVGRGLSLRDVGRVLGVSHQRVDQLVRAGR